LLSSESLKGEEKLDAVDEDCLELEGESKSSNENESFFFLVKLSDVSKELDSEITVFDFSNSVELLEGLTLFLKSVVLFFEEEGNGEVKVEEDEKEEYWGGGLSTVIPLPLPFNFY
jgi:hypothetical protein